MISSSTWTVPSMFSIFTSRYPFSLGQYLPLPKGLETLARVFKRNGYRTCGIHSNAYLSRYYNFDEGFDIYHDYKFTVWIESVIDKIFKGFLRIFPRCIVLIKKIWYAVLAFFLVERSKNIVKRKRRLANHTVPYIDAETITRKGIKFLKRYQSSSVFLWLHYMDLHTPQKLPKNSKLKVSRSLIHNINLKYDQKNPNASDNFSRREREIKTKLYKENVKFISENLQILFKFLNDGSNDEIIALITSDHGEELFENERIGHTAHFTNELINIPCLIWSNRFKNQEIIRKLCSNRDIGPILLYLSNLMIPGSFKGYNPIKEQNCDESEKFVISETYIKDGYPSTTQIDSFMKFCIVTEKWRYIEDFEINTLEIRNNKDSATIAMNNIPKSLLEKVRMAKQKYILNGREKIGINKAIKILTNSLSKDL